MAEVATPRPATSDSPVRPHPPQSRQRGARQDLNIKIVDHQASAKTPMQPPLITPVSVITPPLTPQTSFDPSTLPATPDAGAFPTFLRAFYHYHPEGPLHSEDEQSSITLPINEGDIILVHSVQPNGWADGSLLKCGARGWLPTNYCEAYDNETMSNLLRALTNVWDFLRGHEEEDLGVFRSQDYVRGMIAGVRTLLERTGCLSRDSEPVASQQSIRSLRKILLAELSAFAKKAKTVQEACQNNKQAQTTIESVADADANANVDDKNGDRFPERDWLCGMLDEILLKAMKVVVRAVRFVDMWQRQQRSGQMKHALAGGDKSLPVRRPLGAAPEPSPTDSGVGTPNTPAWIAPTIASTSCPLQPHTAPVTDDAHPPRHPRSRTLPQTPGPLLPLCTGRSHEQTDTDTLASGRPGSRSTSRSRSANNAHIGQRYSIVQESSSQASHMVQLDLPSPVSVTDDSTSPENDCPSGNFAADSCSAGCTPHAHGHNLATATQADTWTHPLAAGHKHSNSSTAAAKRVSASHRLSHTVRTPATSNHVLASDRLCATHEAFLGFIGAFIGIHLQSRRIMELLVTTQQSVLACQALLDVVQEIWERDFRRSDAVDASHMVMHSRLAELVNATKEIFQATEVAGDDGVFCLPDQSKRLVDAATACVRSAGECVTKSRAVIERRGDFEVEEEQIKDGLPPHSRPTRSRSTWRGVKTSTSSAVLPQEGGGGGGGESGDEPRSSSEKALLPTAAALPLSQRRSRTPVPEPPSRPAPRPNFPRSASAHSELSMAPSGTSLRPRGSSLVRTTTVTKKSSETGLRRAGTRAVRATGSTSNLPTLVTENASSSESPIDTGSGNSNSSSNSSSSTSNLHPRNNTSASSLPVLHDDSPSRPQTAHAGSIAHLNMTSRFLASGAHLPEIDTVYANRHLHLDVDIPRTSFFDMGNTPTTSTPEDHLRVERPPLPLSVQNTPDTAMLPPSEATRFERINSGGESIAGSTATKNSSARHSGASATSHASTRATTPDHAAHKTSSDESLQDSLSSVDDESAKHSESQLLAETFAHELTFNADGQVTGGSLSALVERMTSHDSTPDALFVNTFYLTFRLFTTPVELAQSLIERFDRAGDDPEHGGPVRLRVYNVFKSWMEGYWNLGTDAEALKLIIGFANGRLRFDLPSASRRLLDLSLQVSNVSSQSNSPVSPKVPQGGWARPRAISGANPSPEAMAPAPNVSKGQLNAMKNLKNGISTCNLLDLDALELARQFTIMQSRIFCAIQPEELLALEWTKKMNSKGVNIKSMIALSTDLANLVADTILSLELKKRAVMIKHWVKIASKCLELSNYDALMAIISSLNSSILLRLKKTWDLVSPKTLGKLDYLKTVVDVSRNYFVLRQRLHSHIAPCLPFVGIYLTDLTFIDCGNQPTRQHPSGAANQAIINFDKYVRTTRVIGDLQRFQVPYKLCVVPEMQEWMESQISRVRSVDQGNVQNYYRRSLMLEPRDGSNPPPPSKHTTPTENAGSSFGSQGSGKEGNANKFEFWSGLGLSLNKDKAQAQSQA